MRPLIKRGLLIVAKLSLVALYIFASQFLLSFLKNYPGSKDLIFYRIITYLSYLIMAFLFCWALDIINIKKQKNE